MDVTDAGAYFRDLYELGADPSLSVAEKIERTVAVGRDRLGVQYGLLSYTGNGEYEVVDSTITDGGYESGTVHDLEETYCRHVVGDREMLAISDVEDSAYSDDIAADVTGLRCYIGAPVVVDGEAYGTLCYSGDEPLERPFTEDERRFVRLLARWIGGELERDRHHAALEAQNRRLDEFAELLAHDIRGPLTAARGYTELVAETVPEGEAKGLQTALDALDRIDDLIAGALSVSRQGGDVGEREPVELGAVARSAWDTVGPADGTLLVTDDLTVAADRSLLERLFESLFQNVDDRCPAAVTVTVRGTEGGFSVADDGPTIPPETADTLFGDEVDSRRIQFSLLMVERVASGHGWEGRVEVEDGTRFVFSGVGDVTTSVH